MSNRLPPCHHISDTAFLAAWSAHDLVRDVARSLGLTVGATIRRSKTMRRHGLDVPYKPRGRRGAGYEGGPPTSTRPTVPEFIATWEAAGSLDEAARVLNVRPVAAKSRASQLRAAGHKLKRMPCAGWCGPVEFASAWHECATPAEVAERLGLSIEQVRYRVRRLRRAGVELKPMRARRTPAQLRFISAWQSSASIADVADKVGLTPRQAGYRARNLRRRGVLLKAMSRGWATRFAQRLDACISDNPATDAQESCRSDSP